MNKKTKNAWEWVKEHKVEIGLGALAVATTVGGVVLFKKQVDPDVIKQRIKNANTPKKMIDWPKKLDVIDLGVGALDDAVGYENGTVELWMDQIPLEDMGTLGENIRNQFPDLADSKVWALMSINPNKET